MFKLGKRNTKPKTENIFLCGMMGAGKSSVGKILANQLNYLFIDIDREIEKSFGQSIPEMFQERGERYFRGLESAAVQVYAAEKRQVIALGGGALQDYKALEKVLKSGLLVYLKTDPEKLVERIFSDKTIRPLMLEYQDQESARDFLEKLIKKRESGYNQAHITIETSSLTSGQVVQKIVQELK